MWTDCTPNTSAPFRLPSCHDSRLERRKPLEAREAPEFLPKRSQQPPLPSCPPSVSCKSAKANIPISPNPSPAESALSLQGADAHLPQEPVKEAHSHPLLEQLLQAWVSWQRGLGWGTRTEALRPSILQCPLMRPSSPEGSRGAIAGTLSSGGGLGWQDQSLPPGSER